MSCHCRYAVVVKTAGRYRSELLYHWLHSLHRIQEAKDYAGQHPFHCPREIIEFKFCPECGRDLRSNNAD